jgi:formate dehydrogenase
VVAVNLERSHDVARVLCVLYGDPKEGHPLAYARDTIPRIELYADGRTTPSPTAIDFTPGELVGDVTGALGLRKFLAARGHSMTILSDQDEVASRFDQELPEAEIVISQACWPARLTAERIANAHKLRLVIIAGEGVEDVDLEAAATYGITVVEITHSSTVSTAEYAVMLILSLVHNFVPSVVPTTRRAERIADYARRAYDLEGMHVGILGAGRVGLAVLRRLRPFDVRLHYTDPKRLPLPVEDDLRIMHHPTAAAMVPICDVVSIHAPLRVATARSFDADMIGRMKRGAISSIRHAARFATQKLSVVPWRLASSQVMRRIRRYCEMHLYASRDQPCPLRRAMPPVCVRCWNAGSTTSQYRATISLSITAG